MRITFFAFLFCFVAIAEEASSTAAQDAPKWNHESEASVVLASGNSDTQTYSLKQTTGYAWTGNKFQFTGSYLLGKTAGIETAKRWDLGLRYDRVITGDLSGYLGYVIDSNTFAGIDLRHAVDIGAKYNILKTDATQVFGEAGYRLTAEKLTTGASSTIHLARAYGEWLQKWNGAVSSRLWAEFLQALNNGSDYRFNIEPSLSVILTDVFSVKLAYLVNFRNVPAIAGKKKTDTLYTTSLVAKF